MSDPYFDELRRGLRTLPAQRVSEIVEELQAHVEERAQTIGRDAALKALGEPRDIAFLYLASRSPGQSRNPSPWNVLRALRLVARLSIGGLATLSAALVGYGFGLLFIAMALLEPFMPERIGLWIVGGDDPSFSIGRTSNPVGEEVLGWWVIPIGLILGALLIYLTWRGSLAALRALVRTGVMTRTDGELGE